MNFRELELMYSKYYMDHNLTEALNTIESAYDLLSKEEYEEYYFTLLSDKGLLFQLDKQYEKSLACYEELIEKGYPCIEKRFNQLQLEDNETLLNLKKQNGELLKKARAESYFQYQIHLPEGYTEEKEYPLIMLLHGDGGDGNSKDLSYYWKKEFLLKRDYIVLYPQSSQMYCYNGFGWLPNRELSRKEMKNCYEEVINKYSVNKDQVIIGGFSGGAMAVIDFCMHNAFPMKGFISLCPGENIKSFSNEQIIEAATRGVKGVILEGEDDMVLPVQTLLDDFKTCGFKCEYYLNKNVGHWYPNDLEEKTLQAIDFITK